LSAFLLAVDLGCRDLQGGWMIENIEIKAGNVGGNRPHHCSKPLGPPAAVAINIK
jgi:hypothetical protein